MFTDLEEGLHMESLRYAYYQAYYEITKSLTDSPLGLWSMPLKKAHTKVE